MRARTVFISDLHLGTRACKHEYLAAFLERIEAEYLFIVGDGVDLQRLRSRSYWPPEHRAVIRRLATLAREGTRVTYIPGNHDDALRRYAGRDFAGMQLAVHAVHELSNGRRMLLMHGDEYDFVVRHRPLLGLLGGFLYSQLLQMNRVVDALRRASGLGYWSFAGYIKERQPRVRQMVANYRRALCRHARATGCDGVVAGHIHMAGHDRVEGVLYCNPGDWVDSCTAVVEDPCGRVSVVDWKGEERARGAARPVPERSLGVVGLAATELVAPSGP